MHLHNKELIAKVAQSIFTSIIEKYEFELSNYSQIPDDSESQTISIEKNGIIIYCWITNRNGYDLFFRKSDWYQGKNKTFISFLAKVFGDLSEIDDYLQKSRADLHKIVMYTFEYYEYLIQSEITFIETHFPTVFTEGDLSMLEG